MKNSKKEIAFLTSITYPSFLANRIHVINMCRSFVHNGWDVVLFANNFSQEDIFSVYNTFGRNLLESIISIFKHSKNFNYVYSREPRLFLLYQFLSFCSNRKQISIFEIHDKPHGLIDRVSFFIIINLSDRVIVISKSLLEYLRPFEFFKNKRRFLLAPDGVDLNLFAPQEFQRAARKLNARKRVLYSGSFVEWKGTTTLLNVAQNTPEIDFLFVGGRPEEISRMKKIYDSPNIFFLGYKTHELLPQLLQEADVLVIPNSDKNITSLFFTSPLKLFEYLASRKPIVASDIPSIREIVTDRHDVIMFEPDNSIDLKEKILYIVENPMFSERIARNAFLTSKKYSWDNRVMYIIKNLF